ncbi:Nif3-like dinuclear metal center hexameric protein [Hydrocarboniclastica marina]|uniref:GTP cyclohydrolase 1 type 2 homolog n=1 Tax=Hydrocarboniclastica marina TaxID=2259620 RepID=A0A4P7XHN4_9ALTE|nr:Nif3-like dinuclear metal center hexameric protein [Hydrocarboniclastica marina]QCF26558.1 Nif3-like dinuclear metal center hexameric protein [Hydrocarboniclastica marina]
MATVSRDTLVNAMNHWLEPERFSDYCPNGLQVEGREEVTKVVTGVTASQALIDAALEAGADMILVHHGYFWKGEDQRISGIRKKRLRSLLANDLSMVAYHLPLDAHAELGNNRQLARVLELEQIRPITSTDPRELVWQGRLPEPMSAERLAAHIATRLSREPLHVGPDGGEIQTIGWCTGAAQGYLARAAATGLDAFISGEVSEPTVHLAREMGIHYFAAGHHATERYGVQALGERLATEFGVVHQFIDIPNPV